MRKPAAHKAPMSRSDTMRQIRSKDTTPELVVRRALWKLGFRYRLHCKDLPGKPDIVFRGKRKVVFVHGCFWHQHGCADSKLPKSNTDYWHPKLRRNIERDADAVAKLESDGWSVMVVWDCETKRADLPDRLKEFLGC
ncbi:very short patch repair endonuclease [Burkholderia sp. Tr-20390]|uniref:DNA mismatch endonuclease Vsr n=1 Tax=Burkholderia sp. Tr-20390 TaxID=2703904 RepID=UPI001980B22F|nr:DNA mismatch endonuclease Vsr [Burkholderia sp. Tr-20390]